MKLGRLVICGAALLLLVACQNNQGATARVDQPYEPLTDTDTDTASARDPYERPAWSADSDPYRTDDTYATTESAATAGADPYATDPMVRGTRGSRNTQADRGGTEDVIVSADTAVTPGVRTHTVVKGDTLYKLARMYYDDQGKWRDIYEANRSVLSSPDRLTLGMKLRIP